MYANKISLIGTTVGGRDKQIIRLFNSVVGFKGRLEIIFVDQTHDKNVRNLVDKFSNDIDFLIVDSERCSLSSARNLALKSAKGNIIAFCDDDAFYDAETIEFLLSKSYSKTLVVSPVYDSSTNKYYSNRKFPSKNTIFSYGDIVRHALSVGVFIYLDTLRTIPISFNENLGVGSPIGGSEETFLFLSMLVSGFRTEYNPDLKVFHDNDSESVANKLAEKYENYAIGYGYVIRYFLKKSPGSLTFEFFSIFIRCIIGVILKRNKKLYFFRARGLIRGFFKADGACK